MNLLRKAAWAAVAALAAAVCTGPASATDGYFSHGYGTRAKGMGGAGVALPQDSTIVTLNPAGAMRVGNRYDLSAALFHPERGYRVDGNPSGAPGTFGLAPGSHESDNNNFGVPGFTVNRTMNDRAAFAFTLTANGGMNTTYRAEPGYQGPYGSGEAGVNLSQMFFGPTVAIAVGPRTAVGLSAVFAWQSFECRGVKSFGGMVADGKPDGLTDNGASSSTGFGWRIGALHNVTPHLTLGAAFQTQMHMSRFQGYTDLFAEGGKFDIPASATLGLAYRTSNNVVVALDYQHIWYRWIHAVGNPFANIYQGMAGDPTALLGGDNSPGFGWRNMTVWKLGAQWDAGRGWTLRTGINYGRQPIPGSEVLFNILAPGVQQWHYTAGFTKDMGDAGEISLAFMYSPDNTVQGWNLMEAPNQQLITLHMHQVELEMSWGKKF